MYQLSITHPGYVHTAALPPHDNQRTQHSEEHSCPSSDTSGQYQLPVHMNMTIMLYTASIIDVHCQSTMLLALCRRKIFQWLKYGEQTGVTLVMSELTRLAAVVTFPIPTEEKVSMNVL